MSNIEREALQRIRLHGSIFWRDKWGTPAKIANEALLAADGEYAAADQLRGAVSTLEALEDALLRHFTGRVPEPEDDALMMAAQHRARARLRGQVGGADGR